MYNKLFTKILDSTIWLESDATRLVWITFLAVMDEDGFVALPAVGNVAARARVSVEAAETAVKILESSNQWDVAQEHGGRRIERTDHGWIVLNAAKYQWEGRMSPWTWAPIRKAVFKRDVYTCQYCGAERVPLEPDHVHPVSRGGRNDIGNLVASCVPCNRSKGAKTLAEWRH